MVETICPLYFYSFYQRCQGLKPWQRFISMVNDNFRSRSNLEYYGFERMCLFILN